MQSRAFYIFQIKNQQQVDEILNILESIVGVKSIEASHETKMFAIQWTDPTCWEEIEQSVSQLNYTLQIY